MNNDKVPRKVVISRLDTSLLNRMMARKPTQVVKTIDNNQKLRSLYREDVVYESKKGDFLAGDSYSILLVNRLYYDTNHCETIAWYKSKVLGINSVLEKPEQRTSEEITKLIGNDNYDTIFSAICSVINTELKIRAILALLLKPRTYKTSFAQTEGGDFKSSKIFKEVSCQTDRSELFDYRNKNKSRARRPQKRPHVVKDEIFFKEIITNTKLIKKESSRFKFNTEFLKKESQDIEEKNQFEPVVKIEHLNTEKDSTLENISILKEETLLIKPEVLEYEKGKPESTLDKNDFFNEDSDCSLISGFSFGDISLPSTINDTFFDSLIQQAIPSSNIVETENSMQNKDQILNIYDGSKIHLPMKPKSMFHIAVPLILKNKSHEEQDKIKMQQAYIDWKMCMTEIDGCNLPIHMAVLQNDTFFLKRHCIMLSKKGTVDVPTKQGHLTPLQLTLIKDSSPECTKLLLQYGSNPLLADDECRTAFHLAAESSSGHLEALISYCREHPRKIIEKNSSLLKLINDNPSNELLAQRVFDYISTVCDESGCTPLILACRQGKHENAKLLAELSPENVDFSMANCGNTALFEAVGAACVHTQASSNRSKVDENFKKTIQILLQLGANPSKDNDSGANVNTILTDYNINQLSLLIANKTQETIDKSIDKLILVKGAKKSKTSPKSKPVILQNIPVTKPTIVRTKSTKMLPPKTESSKKILKPIVLKSIPSTSKINVNGQPIFFHNFKASLHGMPVNTISKAATFKPNFTLKNISGMTTPIKSTNEVVPKSIHNIKLSSTPSSSAITSTTIVDKPGNIVLTNSSKRKIIEDIANRKQKTQKNSG